MASISAAKPAEPADRPHPPGVPFKVTLEGSAEEPLTVELVPEAHPLFRVQGELLAPKVRRLDRGSYEVELEGRKHQVTVEGRAVTVDGIPLALSVRKAPPTLAGRLGAAGIGSGRIEVKPPMPGKIVEVKVAKGGRVAKGDVLVVLEAMKMQNEILAPAGGTVAEVGVKAGETIDAKRVLAVIEPEARE